MQCNIACLLGCLTLVRCTAAPGLQFSGSCPFCLGKSLTAVRVLLPLLRVTSSAAAHVHRFARLGVDRGFGFAAPSASSCLGSQCCIGRPICLLTRWWQTARRWTCPSSRGCPSPRGSGGSCGGSCSGRRRLRATPNCRGQPSGPQRPLTPSCPAAAWACIRCPHPFPVQCGRPFLGAHRRPCRARVWHAGLPPSLALADRNRDFGLIGTVHRPRPIGLIGFWEKMLTARSRSIPPPCATLGFPVPGSLVQ